ncbi:unnamed protein product [Effrenium voratum]|uniref:Uncharacterized protein n=1 Tax=Effrenium voratum TaxID=2562239 RepID=A0AA36JJV2_9DINO|nr:unnamed protein product [Effrenium voratum]
MAEGRGKARPTTLIEPKAQEPEMQTLPASDWFQAQLVQVLELRPGGWDTVDLKSAIKLAHGEKVEPEKAAFMPSSRLSKHKDKTPK